jgi:hypothetical protein
VVVEHQEKHLALVYKVVVEQVDIENLFQILQQEVYQFQFKVIQ